MPEITAAISMTAAMILEEGIWAIQSAIQETYPAAFKLVKKYSKKDARRVVAGLDDAISSIIHLCSDNESDF